METQTKTKTELKIRTLRKLISTKRSIVYVDTADRPGMSDIAADFAWRRNHEQPFSSEEMKKMLIDQFPAIFDDNIKVAYSRLAGCTMCPCSPGYNVKGMANNFEIWLEA